MADEDWLKQDKKKQGKPKVVANGKLKGRLKLKHASDYFPSLQ